MISGWIYEHIIEIFGAVTGIIYVFLEIRQNILLWPLGIITSAVYIYIFRTNGFYAGMVLQGYYLVISIYGWRAWRYRSQGGEHSSRSTGKEIKSQELKVSRINIKTSVICLGTAILLWIGLWYILDKWTDSPVPLWDGLITSLSVVATWMLTRKFIEQWYVWIVANAIAVIVYLASEMFPTAVLFFVYLVMAIIGVMSWSRDHHVMIRKK